MLVLRVERFTMNLMTKKKKVGNINPETTQSKEQPAVWKLFTKIDVALKEPFEAYAASLEYPVDQARIIERAFREFLERQGFWPHKPESDCSGSKQ